MTTRAPIRIIGAGLAGLTLGRRLKQLNIPAVLYEKTPPPSSSFSRHNYAMTLQYSTWHDILLDLLGTNGPTLEKRLCVDYENLNKIVDGTGRKIDIANDDSSIPDELKKDIRIVRSKLEEWLRDGLDIRHETEMSDPTLITSEQSSSSSSGHTDNGSSDMKNPILTICADGVHSKLRQKLSPSTELEILPYVAYYGRRTISLEDYSTSFHDKLLGGKTFTLYKPPSSGQNSSNVRLQVHTNVFKDDGNKVEIAYTYSRPARVSNIDETKDNDDGVKLEQRQETQGEQEEQDPLYTPTRSPSAAKKVPDALFTELESFATSILSSTDQFTNTTTTKNLINSLLLSPSTNNTTSEQQQQQSLLQKDKILSWLMRSHILPFNERLRISKQYNITFIGDAAMSSPIVGGNGANVAIFVADMLGKWIAENRGNEMEMEMEEWEKLINGIYENEKAEGVEGLERVHRHVM